MAKTALKICKYKKSGHLKIKVYEKFFSLTFPDFFSLQISIPWLSLTFPDFPWLHMKKIRFSLIFQTVSNLCKVKIFKIQVCLYRKDENNLNLSISSPLTVTTRVLRLKITSLSAFSGLFRSALKTSYNRFSSNLSSGCLSIFRYTFLYTLPSGWTFSLFEFFLELHSALNWPA